MVTYPVESRSDIVPIQAVDMLAMSQDKLLLQGLGNRTLAASREAGHPQRDSFLAHGSVALSTGQMANLLGPAFACRGTFNNMGWGQGQVLGTHLSQVQLRQVHHGALHILRA